MNKEKLEKINKLVDKYEGLNNFLSSEGKKTIRAECRNENNDIINAVYYIDYKQFEPSLYSYLDQLKAELKELGYEE